MDRVAERVALTGLETGARTRRSEPSLGPEAVLLPARILGRREAGPRVSAASRAGTSEGSSRG